MADKILSGMAELIKTYLRYPKVHYLHTMHFEALCLMTVFHVSHLFNNLSNLWISFFVTPVFISLIASLLLQPV